MARKPPLGDGFMGQYPIGMSRKGVNNRSLRADGRVVYKKRDDRDSCLIDV